MLKYKGMKILANFFGKLTEDVQIKTLLKIIFVLLIVFLLKETDIAQASVKKGRRNRRKIMTYEELVKKAKDMSIMTEI